MWSWLASLIGTGVITGLIKAYQAKLGAANIGPLRRLAPVADWTDTIITAYPVDQ
jgi:hypothetical protein